METNYKISIPKPCHENWDEMAPEESGRFCNSCAKSVVDFTGMKANEIQEFFVKHQGQKVCGRFRNEQLDSIIIQIPREILFSQVQFHKMFLLALLVCMGTTLFSCQNSNGDKQNIGEVEVVDSLQPRVTKGVLLPKKNTECETDTITVKPIDKRHTTTGDTEIIPATTGIVAVNAPEPKRGTPEENEILTAAAVDVKPEFPGGLTKFYEYINSNFNIPQEHKNITARMIVTFVINVDGTLSETKLLRGINLAIDKEVLRVLKTSPKWIPGEYNGKKVRVSYSLPIKIKASE